MIWQVVKLGHYQAFMTAMAAWNDAARNVGLPPYRIWDSQFGTVQEVFTEAEFDGIDALQTAFEAAHTDATFVAANDAVSAHLVDGSLHDYVLFET
jgi:hypothetical protein